MSKSQKSKHTITTPSGNTYRVRTGWDVAPVMGESEDYYLQQKDVAEALGISRADLRQKLDSGEIPSKKFYNRRMIHRDIVLALLKQ